MDYKEVLSDILVKLNKMTGMQTVLDNIARNLKPRDLQVLQLRQTKTLQEVGEVIDVTRERVRQIEAQEP